MHLSVGVTAANNNLSSNINSTAVGIGDTLVVLGPPAPDSENENTKNIDIYKLTESGEFVS